MGKTVIFHNKQGLSLKPQKKINQHHLPFTLNPCIGCLFGCSYCYVESSSFRHTVFGKEVVVKTWLPSRLDKELKQYSKLPQHLKRVQINSNCESYLPQVMAKTKQAFGKDIMRQVLEIFQRHWDRGNHWMVHLFTKSHLVVEHLDILKEMRHQVQVEVTIPTLNEESRELMEGSAPSVKRRLKAVEQLSRAGVFVRIMAMPLFRTEEAKEIRRAGFEHGARGFKNKGLHYWEADTIIDVDPIRTKGPEFYVNWDLCVNSGEPVLEQGPKTVKASMPTSKWLEFKEKDMVMENAGYSELNDIDWGYIV